MMFELECLSTVRTLEAPQEGGFVMADHVTLEAVHVGEVLVTDGALLKQVRS